MLELIRLEWKKNGLRNYVIAAVILALVLCVFLFAFTFMGIANDPETGVPDTAPGHEGVSAAVELFTGMSYLVFTSVMLSAFIVSAYKNKTMNLMFSYPIKRQKIIASQMLAVWLFCLGALILTKLLLYGCIALGARFFAPAFPLDFHMGSLGFYLQLSLKSVVIVTMGFIALFVGVAMKSSKATIVSSFLLILLTQANIGDLSLSGSAVFPLVLTAVSLLCAVLSLRKVEERDLM